VLYLLHGCCDSYVSWNRSTDIAQLSKDSDVIVAMPDGGSVGFYSDWRAGPRWETFHTTELPPPAGPALPSRYGRGRRRTLNGRPGRS
jgi:diacylglycerol O-acyltransferase/trehalose O-mycolyltransferase